MPTKKWFLGIIISAAFILGFSFGNKSQPETKKNSSTSNIINLQSFSDNPDLVNFSAQVDAPSFYYVTDDDMITFYGSQGGMAPPRLILNKNFQFLDTENYYKFVTTPSTNDCINIWSTGSISDIESWIGLLGLNGSNADSSKIHLSEKESFNVGKRTADIYKLTEEKGEILVGFIKIGDKFSTSYFFNSCNTNNKTDLINLIKSIKFRGDLKF